MSRALITGIGGQDAFYLANLLHENSIEIWGTSQSGEMPPDLPFVRAAPALDLVNVDSIDRVIQTTHPIEIYHLAGQTSVAESWNDPTGTGIVTGLGTVHLLEATLRYAPEAHVFVASSSEIFGRPAKSPQSEETPLQPVSPYGAAKAYAYQCSQMFRERFGLFVSCGILYNHESPRRPSQFVTSKIVNGAVAIKRGEQAELRLGNLDVIRDWGFAGDYVKAMKRSLESEESANYVIATGVGHSVRDVCRVAFEQLDLDYQDYVVSDPAFWREAEPVPLIGDNSLARKQLGWTPQTSFRETIAKMVEAEVHLSAALPKRDPL